LTFSVYTLVVMEVYW